LTTDKEIETVLGNYREDEDNPNYYLYRAIELAVRHHYLQQDRLGKLYILHPLHVMSAFTNINEQMIAIMHDVVEDTSVDIEDLIEMGFPQVVIDAMVAITRDNKEPYDEYIKRVGKNKLATKVKVSDLYHNTEPNRRKGVTVTKLKQYTKALNYLLGVVGMTPKYLSGEEI
jgi:(p)ppGpp synthase/HD superfamily hydrolase